jgi:hypothetical protein
LSILDDFKKFIAGEDGDSLDGESEIPEVSKAKEKKNKKRASRKNTKEEKHRQKKYLQAIIEKYRSHPIHRKLPEEAKYRALFNGEDFMYKDKLAIDTNNSLYPQLSEESGAFRSPHNRIKVAGNNTLGRLLAESPKIDVIPANASDEARMAAFAAKAICDDIFNRSRYRVMKETHMAAKNALWGSCGWLWVTVGESCRYGSNSPRNSWDVEAEDNFSVFVDPTAKNYYQMDWCIRGGVVSLQKVKDTFPEANCLDKIRPQQMNNIESLRESYVLDRSERNASATDISQQVNILEYYERPSRSCEKGKKITIVNEKYIIQEDENPMWEYGLFCLPAIPIAFNRDSNSLLGNSTVKDAMPIQLAMNELHQHIMNNIMYTGSRQLVYHSQSKVKSAPIADARFALEYNGTEKPFFVSPPPMPPEGTQWFAVLDASMDQVFGIYEINRGNLPTGGSQMSGITMKYLQDAAWLRHKENLGAIGEALQILCQIIVRYVMSEFTTEQIADAYGASALREFEVFKNRKMDEDFEITLFLGSSLANSPQMKAEALLNANDRDMPAKARAGDEIAIEFMTNMGFVSPESAYNTYKTYRDKAFSDLEKFLKVKFNELGEPESYENLPAISDYDNLAIQFNTFNLKRMEYGFAEKYGMNTLRAIEKRVADLDKKIKQQNAPAEQPGGPSPMAPTGNANGIAMVGQA